MDIKELCPKPSERMLIVGATGTGKTTLAKQILGQYDRVLVIDPKATYEPDENGPKYKRVGTVAGLRLFSRRSHLHFRPRPGHLSVATFDAVYQWAYLRRNAVVYTDETYLTMRHTQSPDWQRNLVTCGRELGIGAIFATQRPSGIDLRIYTESEHKVCFYLANIDDRKRMAEEMGRVVLIDPVEASGGLPYAFWYWNSKSRKTKLAQLKLPEDE